MAVPSGPEESKPKPEVPQRRSDPRNVPPPFPNMPPIEQLVRNNRDKYYFECAVTLSERADLLTLKFLYFEDEFADLKYLINVGDRHLKAKVKKMEANYTSVEGNCLKRLACLEAQMVILNRERDRRILCELD